MKKFAFILSCLLISAAVVRAQQANTYNKDSAQVADRMMAFLTAFNNLNWKDFRSFLDKNVTAFLESDTLTLVEGKTGVENMFKPLFDETPKRMKGPPYLNLKPLNLHITAKRHGGCQFSPGQAQYDRTQNFCLAKAKRHMVNCTYTRFRDQAQF